MPVGEKEVQDPTEQREQLIGELKEQNQQLLQQIVALQSLIALPQPMSEEPTGYLVIRSNISGHTTIIHPNIEWRGVRGDRAIKPFSEIVVSGDWRESPNLAVSVRMGVVTVTEVAEPPETVVTMPDIPQENIDVQDPLHKAIAIDIAKQGVDSDEGDISSYPKTLQLLLQTDIRRQTGGLMARGGVNIGYMQDVVRPVLECALDLETRWRNRGWVVGLLEGRITEILNLSSFRGR